LLHDPEPLYLNISGSVRACAEIMSVMLRHARFREAFISDGRSFDRDVFAIICNRLHCYGASLEASKTIADAAVSSLSLAAACTSGDLQEEIPSEFLDALTFEVMDDPVQLPR
jgi:hypothetical protein